MVVYARVGLDLARAVRDTMVRRPQAHALVLMHHGLVTWGTTARAAYDATIELVSRAETYLEKRPVRSLGTPPSSAADRERKYLALAPVIRGVLVRRRQTISATGSFCRLCSIPKSCSCWTPQRARSWPCQRR